MMLMFLDSNTTFATRVRQDPDKENEDKLNVPLRTQSLELLIYIFTSKLSYFICTNVFGYGPYAVML